MFSLLFFAPAILITRNVLPLFVYLSKSSTLRLSSKVISSPNPLHLLLSHVNCLDFKPLSEINTLSRTEFTFLRWKNIAQLGISRHVSLASASGARRFPRLPEWFS